MLLLLMNNYFIYISFMQRSRCHLVLRRRPSIMFNLPSLVLVFLSLFIIIIFFISQLLRLPLLLWKFALEQFLTDNFISTQLSFNSYLTLDNLVVFIGC